MGASLADLAEAGRHDHGHLGAGGGEVLDRPDGRLPGNDHSCELGDLGQRSHVRKTLDPLHRGPVRVHRQDLALELLLQHVLDRPPADPRPR